MTEELDSLRRRTAGSEPTDGPRAAGDPLPDGRDPATVDGGLRRADWERDAPAVAASVSSLRNAVAAAAEQAGATESERADVALAVSEALSNVVNHAYTDRALPGRMHVGVAVDGGSLLVVVSDAGSGMRPRVDSSGAGLGLAMMSALTSELTMSAGEGGAGTRVSMRFALDGRR
jgi:serine/threonine-protein kinase RsbW